MCGHSLILLFNLLIHQSEGFDTPSAVEKLRCEQNGYMVKCTWEEPEHTTAAGIWGYTVRVGQYNKTHVLDTKYSFDAITFGFKNDKTYTISVTPWSNKQEKINQRIAGEEKSFKIKITGLTSHETTTAKLEEPSAATTIPSGPDTTIGQNSSSSDGSSSDNKTNNSMNSELPILYNILFAELWFILLVIPALFNVGLGIMFCWRYRKKRLANRPSGVSRASSSIASESNASQVSSP
ncbi:hypothetical protein Ciccas_012176 [Cichlidogyrus casuarinus]|uniref:Fibronectin type-III domain-containing protein n=1 Tax=Cichlidogyrus casuarinus TaxID=1844966 RepID=A0ABD2PP45_9PLAT